MHVVAALAIRNSAGNRRGEINRLLRKISPFCAGRQVSNKLWPGRVTGENKSFQISAKWETIRRFERKRLKCQGLAGKENVEAPCHKSDLKILERERQKVP
jgi:hypothetical protein